jgi:hypothetical protein
MLRVRKRPRLQIMLYRPEGLRSLFPKVQVRFRRAIRH